MNMERQLDTGSGELDVIMDMDRQLEIGSGEPVQEGKLESEILIGMCSFGMGCQPIIW